MIRVGGGRAEFSLLLVWFTWQTFHAWLPGGVNRGGGGGGWGAVGWRETGFPRHHTGIARDGWMPLGQGAKASAELPPECAFTHIRVSTQHA